METIRSPHSRMRSSGGPPFSALSTHWNSGTFQSQALPQFERQRPRGSRTPADFRRASGVLHEHSSPWPQLGRGPCLVYARSRSQNWAMWAGSVLCVYSKFSAPPPFVQDQECQLSQHLTPSPMSKAKCHLLHDGLLDSILPPTSTG